MLRNHLKIAIRNLNKRRGFALINVVGLSLGLWCTLLIGLWIADELDKDGFHVNGDRIAQVMTTFHPEEGAMDTWDGTGYPVGQALARNIPELEKVVRTAGPREAVIKIGEKTTGAKVIGADGDFFQLFSFPLKIGSTDKCLSDLKYITLSEELADSYFPKGNAVGKTVNLMLDEITEPFLVSGIFKKLPEASTLQFDAVVPLDNFLPMNNKSWGNTWVRTYVLYGENTKIEQLGSKIKDLPESVGADRYRTLSLQPLEDHYLYSKFENGKVVGGRIDNVVLFGIIAIFILLIACFNFINLTTALAIKRSKEVGIKKVLGAGKVSLLGQFFAESVLLVFIAVVVAVILAFISIPTFNTITEKTLSLDLSDPRFYGMLSLIAIATVLFSGLYPAFSMASLKSTNALQSKLRGSKGEAALRKGLVVFQFFLCMAMITGTLVVYLQLDYVQNKNLGLDRDNVLYMPMDGETYLQSRAVKAELANFSGIKEVSSAGSNFIDMGGYTSDPTWEGRADGDGIKSFAIIDVDFKLLEMLGIKLKQGRSFSPEFATDTLNYIVNEAAVNLMEIDDPIGKSMRFWGDEGGKIVGIVNNFNFTSLHNPIAPLIIRCRPSNTGLFYVKTQAGNSKDAIAHMAKVQLGFSELPFSYHFLNDTIERGYRDEQKVQQLSSIFAALAIIISCLGLFGLAMFTANQRIKEIAVRKVLGANVSGLFRLLSKDFIKLVVVALLIAVPISWYVMNDWIQSFAFHIAIRWWMFALGGMLLMLIALLTVSYQTLKVAITNPARSLRTE